MSKGLKDELLSSLGQGVKCSSTNSKHRSIQTFFIEIEKSPKRRAMSNDINVDSSLLQIKSKAQGSLNNGN